MNDSPQLQLHLDEPPPLKFYMVIDGQRRGPFAPDELPAHGLEHDTLVWHTGLSEWVRADTVPALRDVLLTVPPPLPELPPPLPRPAPVSDTPDTFRRLYRWWLSLTAATVALPMLGGVFLIAAQTEWGPRRTPNGFTYYEYSSAGRAFMALGTLLLASGTLPLVAAVVVFCVLLYKMWALIQDGQAQTTPEKAVGFLFIPFFNFYWVFVAVYGLAVDLGRYPRRHGGPMDMVPPSPGLAVAFCVLFICFFVPYLNALTLIPMLVVLVLLVMSLANAAITLAAARRRAAVVAAEDFPEAITRRRPGTEGA
jgi:hypothetical protein